MVEEAVNWELCALSSLMWGLLHPQIFFFIHSTDVQRELLMSRESRPSSLQVTALVLGGWGLFIIETSDFARHLQFCAHSSLHNILDTY